MVIANMCIAVDYNSWIESPKALKLASKLDKDVVLAEGELPTYSSPGLHI